MVRVHPEPRCLAGTGDHALVSSYAPRRQPLRDKDIHGPSALGGFPLQPPQSAHFLAAQGVDTRHSAFGTPDVEFPAGKVDVVPPQGHEFAGPQAVSICDQNRRGVPVPPPVPLRDLDEVLDLALGQVFPRPARSNCYIFSMFLAPLCT